MNLSNLCFATIRMLHEAATQPINFEITNKQRKRKKALLSLRFMLWLCTNTTNSTHSKCSSAAMSELIHSLFDDIDEQLANVHSSY